MVLVAVFAIGEVLAASDNGSQAMWKAAPVWICEQGEYKALCASNLTQGCRENETKEPDILTLDFTEKNVQRETSFGRSYLPIAARYRDRQSGQTVLILGGDRSATMLFEGENSMIIAPSPGGSSVSMEFFTCQPKPAE